MHKSPATGSKGKLALGTHGFPGSEDAIDIQMGGSNTTCTTLRRFSNASENKSLRKHQLSKGGASDDGIRTAPHSLCENEIIVSHISSLPSRSDLPSRIVHERAHRSRSCSESQSTGRISTRPYHANPGSVESFAYISKGGRLTPHLQRPTSMFLSRPDTTSFGEASNISGGMGNPSAASGPELSERTATTLAHHISENKSSNPITGLKHIHKTREITGHEYNVLSLYLFIISFAYNLVVYGAAFAVIVHHTQVTDVNKDIAVYVSGGVLIHLVVQIAMSGGYCLYKHKHPLPKSRLILHMLLCVVLGLAVACMTYLGLLYHLQIISFRWEYAHLCIMCVRQLFIAVLIGTQVCRQRMIYLLFVVNPYTRTLSKHIYEYTLAIILTTSLLCLIPYIYISVSFSQGFARWAPVIPCLEQMCLVAVLMYYTYLSRNVKEGFSDWRANMRVGLVIAVSSVLVYVLCVHILVPDAVALVPPTSVAYIVLPMYMTLFALGVCLWDIFLMVALITGFGLDVHGSLDPAHTVLSGWERAVHEDNRRKVDMEGSVLSNCLLAQTHSTVSGCNASMLSATPTVQEVSERTEDECSTARNSLDRRNQNPVRFALAMRGMEGGGSGESSSGVFSRSREFGGGADGCLCRSGSSLRNSTRSAERCHSLEDGNKITAHKREIGRQRSLDQARCGAMGDVITAEREREGCVTARAIVSSNRGLIHSGSNSSNGSSTVQSVLRFGAKCSRKCDQAAEIGKETRTCHHTCACIAVAGDRDDMSNNVRSNSNNVQADKCGCLTHFDTRESLSRAGSVSSGCTVQSAVRFGGSQSIEYMRASNSAQDSPVIYEGLETNFGDLETTSTNVMGKNG